MRNLFLFFLAVLLSGCDKDSDGLPAADELVARFLEEGAAHNHIIVNTDLTIILQDTIIRNGISYGGYTSTTLDTVRIAVTSPCWTTSATTREIIVFHELGHAFLSRNHTNAQLPNGDWKSIMNTGSLVTGLYVEDRNAFKRNYYMDELFDPDNTPSPSWSFPGILKESVRSAESSSGGQANSCRYDRGTD